MSGLKKTLDQYNQSLHELKDYQKNHQETIRISVCPGIKQLLGLEFFKKFQIHNPGICLKTEFHSDVECEEALYHGKTDAAFLDWPEYSDDYDTYLVVKSPLVAVMRTDHILSHKATNEYESFYRDLPKSNNGIALTFRFLCEGLEPNLTVIPIKEESFIELFYCVRKDHPKSLALERFSDYVYQNVDVYES